MTKTTITTALAALSLMAGASQSFAAQPGESVTFKVSTWGLNLGEPDDARAMLGRIERAAGRACMDPAPTVDLQRRQDYDACVARNAAAAVGALHAPLVTALAGQGLPKAFAAAEQR